MAGVFFWRSINIFQVNGLKVDINWLYLLRLVNAVITHVAKLWQGYSALVERLLKLWRDYSGMRDYLW